MTRWDDLFTDLEAQAAALETAERAGEIDERTRIEVGALAMLDRIRPALGTALQVRVLGDVTVTGTLERLGADWMLLEEGGGRESLISLGAVVTIAGLGRLSAVPGSGGAVLARLTMRSALRGVARDRLPVRAHLRDGTALAATIDRVGADFVEMARHAPGEPRRHGEVRDVILVSIDAIAAVRRAV